jgi:hypothetical protein
MSTDSSRFDPRFDAAFQPGYDGPLAAAASAVAGAGLAAGPNASVPTSAPVEPLRDAAASEHRQPEVPRDAQSESPASPDELRRRNPYLVALAVLGVVLVGIGVAVIAQARSLFDSNRADLDYVTIQLMLVSGPVAIALGVAIGASFLVILSLRHRG